MRGDGGAASNVGRKGMQLYVLNHDWRSSNNVWRQVRFREDHFHADVHLQDDRNFADVLMFGCPRMSSKSSLLIPTAGVSTDGM